MMDNRKLEKIKNNPGIYRKHSDSCKRPKRCSCPYVVRWKSHGKSYKQMFPTRELAREHKAKMASGGTRRPQSSQTVARYYEPWLPNY
jgi:hypothetical protein